MLFPLLFVFAIMAILPSVHGNEPDTLKFDEDDEDLSNYLLNEEFTKTYYPRTDNITVSSCGCSTSDSFPRWPGTCSNSAKCSDPVPDCRAIPTTVLKGCAKLCSTASDCENGYFNAPGYVPICQDWTMYFGNKFGHLCCRKLASEC